MRVTVMVAAAALLSFVLLQASQALGLNDVAASALSGLGAGAVVFVFRRWFQTR